MMIVFIVFFIVSLIGIYGIYIGLKTIGQLLFPIGVLKIEKDLRPEEIARISEEFKKHQQFQKTLIIQKGFDYKQYINI